WTTVTCDGAVAAHWEHTVAVTEHGPWVLTARRHEVELLGQPGQPAAAAVAAELPRPRQA
ncbi:MAG TPA: hypothetical protein VK891_13670, partial [Euzebyales bacterium]|nr:hypothetical protein [Euzebyales bacterium]